MSILRRLSDEKIVLAACDGKRTIATSQGLFTGWVDPDFGNWDTNHPSEATPETSVAVHEMGRNANFAQMFTSLSGDVSKLVLTQDQIIQFVEKHQNWLHPEDWATFFLFQNNEEFFVARVNRYDGGLEAGVYRFGRTRVWGAEGRHRLVVPQL